MSLLHQGVSYLRYLARARDAHNLHSPFIFNLYRAVEHAAKYKLRLGPWLEDRAVQKQVEAGWERLERERTGLLSSQKEVEILDFGAGSLVSAARRRTVASLARTGLLPARWCRRLAALRMHLPAGPVLELGTSLGLTTAYLASLPIDGKVYTMEGCPQVVEEAEALWVRLGLRERIEVVPGNIDETLASVLDKGPFSLIILDANHRSEPVMRYFEQLMPHLHPEGCLVLDDIYWTADMTSAWDAVRTSALARQSLDLYRQGWVFARQGQAREQFVLQALG